VSFRERMRVPVSSAEIMVLEELQRRRLNGGMATQVGFEFGEGGARGTWVDFYWRRARYAVFLDGPPHLKERQERRDELVTKALEGMGIRVDRFAYRAPLTKRRLTEICDQIELRLVKIENEELKEENVRLRRELEQLEEELKEVNVRLSREIELLKEITPKRGREVG
jgi:very-short-patch-repair endonuclease